MASGGSILKAKISERKALEDREDGFGWSSDGCFVCGDQDRALDQDRMFGHGAYQGRVIGVSQALFFENGLGFASEVMGGEVKLVKQRLQFLHRWRIAQVKADIGLKTFVAQELQGLA